MTDSPFDLEARLDAIIEDLRNDRDPNKLEIENLMTDGYARVLELETERRRIARKLELILDQFDESDIEALRFISNERLRVDDELAVLQERLEVLKAAQNR